MVYIYFLLHCIDMDKNCILFALAALIVIYFLAKVSVPRKYEKFTGPDVSTYDRSTTFYDFGNRSMFP